MIDNAVSHTYNSIRDKITELFGSTAESIPEEQAALANELLNLTESWLNTTRESVYSLFGEVAGAIIILGAILARSSGIIKVCWIR
ncbi:hypothetical protein DMB90_12015 [Raoultella planticola]|uniref:Uncharacterized protein n=1 Tax=Raoultella planticola TaxID=575 RepID=A0A5P6AAB8_RAOPL|nr:hypothetical protein DMB90_12015 [Raoultella planticola]